MNDAAKLAIFAGTLLHRLRRGDAVVGALRADMTALLAGVLTSTAGHGPAVRIDTDPCALIDLAVELCRASGVSGIDMAARFNAAVERSVGPSHRRAP